MKPNNNMVPQKPRFSVAITTPQYQKLISNTLSDPKRASRFIASITSAVAINPALQECDAGTILAGALLGESLNLSPSPQLGQYYLVPFECKLKGDDGKPIYLLDEQGNRMKDKRGYYMVATEKRAQFVLGYKGYIQMSLRSGSYSDLDTRVIKEGEYLGRDPNTGKPLFHFIEDDDQWESLPVVGYMAYFEYLNGFRKTMYWSKGKMLNHADQYSPAFSAKNYEKLQNGEIPDNELWKYSSFWYKDFDGMALKTMLRQLVSKWGIMSTDMQAAIEKDATTQSISTKGNVIGLPEDPAPHDDIIDPDTLPSSAPPPAAEKVNLNDL